MKKLILTFVSSILMIGLVYSQTNKIPIIGSKAPSFREKSTNGKVRFPKDYGKDWKVLISHPADFDPVSTSELLELANMQKEFNQLGVKLAVISSNELKIHKVWKSYLETLDFKGRGPQKIEFPLLSDYNQIAARRYGLRQKFDSIYVNASGVVIIDPSNTIRSMNFYPPKVGFNVAELKRMIEAMQVSDKSSVSIPANWKPGDDVLVGHYPYTQKEIANNPKLKDKYYSVGDRLWYEKGDQSGTADKN